MLNRILMTSAAAILAGGMATAQTLVPESEVTDVDGHQTTVGAEARAAGTEIVDTAQAVGDATGDALQNLGEGLGELARQGGSAASDAGARMEAALTMNALVTSADGQIIGVISQVDATTSTAVIDLDLEMENAIAEPVDSVMLPAAWLMPVEDGYVLQMDSAELAAAVNAEGVVQLDGLN
jgi:hypothetical protein